MTSSHQARQYRYSYDLASRLASSPTRASMKKTSNVRIQAPHSSHIFQIKILHQNSLLIDKNPSRTYRHLSFSFVSDLLRVFPLPYRLSWALSSSMTKDSSSELLCPLRSTNAITPVLADCYRCLFEPHMADKRTGST